MINYRPLTTNDFDDFHDVALSSWIWTYKNIHSDIYIRNFINNTYSEEKMLEALKSSNENNGFNYIALDEDTVIGFITLGPDEDTWQLFRMYLLPEYVGKGVGSQLLLLGENFITSNKGTKYHLTVHKDNELGKNFYFKKGFKHIPEKDDDDEWYMEKEL
jgi:ribosomal protein S18 acetylase RimI-like enzyme